MVQEEVQGEGRCGARGVRAVGDLSVASRAGVGAREAELTCAEEEEREGRGDERG